MRRPAAPYWAYHAKSGIRTAVSVGQYKRAGGGTGYAIYFADGAANAYGVDANTGKEIWTRKVEEHPQSRVTGSPAYYNGRVYVAVAGLNEEAQGGRVTYECCTFRGSVVALDAATGAVVWKTYTIAEEPKKRGVTKEGTQAWGPAGAGIWAAPTIDARRRVLYVSTGNGYADPQQPTTDAVIAMDLDTGKIKWVAQPGAARCLDDGLQGRESGQSALPGEAGSRPRLLDVADARQTHQRPATFCSSSRSRAWRTRSIPTSRARSSGSTARAAGSGLGGQWGGAVDDKLAYFGVNGFLSQTPGGMRAVKIDTGEEVWSKPPADKLCGTARGCSAAQGAALTAVPGIVFSGSGDGGLRAYASDDGTVVWQFDTNRSFETVNGVKANGAAMDGPGAAVVNGMLYINSGYGGIVGRPGNVLLAFGVD